MKKFILISLTALFGIFSIGMINNVEAKSYIKSYSRKSGTKVRSYIRYKADGYKFNNYMYRSDRGYRR